MSVIHDIQANVKAKIAKDHSENIVEDVVRVIANEVLATRTNKLVAAYKMMEVLTRELKNIRPDVEGTFNAEGGVVTEPQYSGKTVKQIQQKKGEISKLENAIDKAVTEANYDPLNGIVK